jgi:ElaB/YqjD/DUF883 family membrane-anchored ribosome-binding protein
MKRATGIAIRTGAQIAKAGCEVFQFKSALSEAASEPLATAKRMMRRGQFAAEDLRDEMALAIRKQPFKTIGIALGVGFGIGLLIGWKRPALAGRPRTSQDAVTFFKM